MSELVRLGVQAAASEHVRFRRSVPRTLGKFMGFIHSENDDEARDAFKDQVLQLFGDMAEVLSEGPFDAAADQRSRAFLRERLPPYLSPTERSAAVGGDYYTTQLPVTVGSRVRLLRADCARLVYEDGMAIVYHAMANARAYRAHDEQSIEFGPDFGPALETLLVSYPDYIVVRELPELEAEDQVALVETLFDAGLLRFE
jgi:lysine-specific demethylase/histidyl-hydroxylase NO66